MDQSNKSKNRLIAVQRTAESTENQILQKPIKAMDTKNAVGMPNHI